MTDELGGEIMKEFVALERWKAISEMMDVSARQQGI